MSYLPITPTDLPAHLAERVTVEGSAPAADAQRGAAGTFVLYWMRTAVRAHENPALDVARAMANRLGLPMVVYHGLSERYPHASDRHHTFILEGARDVEAECHVLGVPYAFHLERPGHRAPALRELARRAALVVTETFPIPPLDDLTRGLAENSHCPVWSVDTACIVPMPLAGRAFTRAFAFRDATAAVRAERVTRAWPAVHTAPPAFAEPLQLPFEPVRLSNADIAKLVSQCQIDHGVAAVPHTRGGTVAGYARWQQFVASGALRRYADRRNDPVFEGVSRMSAYLHYGMVSPFRLAREAAAIGGEGATKYLDELLIWREVAYAFCYWHPAPTTIAAIPDWARNTLADHVNDDRVRQTWETLARSRTGDTLWDAAQTSLRIHGELHNNVRMTWGKQLLLWSADAEETLERLTSLNHRYALDGRDPASYGGLLWCLGQFDRPFQPEVPVLGTVRPRPTRQHATRIDVARFAGRVETPALARPPRVLVVGAGISGLACARTLQDHGLSVTVLEKSRGVGGRLSSRRDDTGPLANGVLARGTFNHGVHEFRVRDRRLIPFADAWADAGVIVSHNGQWTGAPAINALAQHLAADLDVRRQCQVAELARLDGGWRVTARRATTSGTGLTQQDDTPDSDMFDADVLALAVPAPQAIALLATRNRLHETAALPSGEVVDMQTQLSSVMMQPCWSIMLTFDKPVAHVRLSAALANVCVVRPQDASTDGAPAIRWVIQTNAAWSREQLEGDAADIAALMASSISTEAASPASSDEPAALIACRAHRWRYAQVERGLPDDCLWQERSSLGACGDWAGMTEDHEVSSTSHGVQRAWLSGVALAGRILSGGA